MYYTRQVVPNIKGVQRLSILDVAAELARLAELVRPSCVQ
jgi:pyruvate/2-oxoglutarate dehydrogenase complex dihydrolipoamide acyltransferase (E2) component